MSLTKLFLIFVKIGAILLGGGYVILPIMQSEFADKRKLFSEEELINYYTLAQSLPGIVAANMTMFIGYKLNGKWGAVAAMFGIIFVPFFSIALLSAVLEIFVSNEYVQNAMWGVGIGVISLILLTVREMWQNTSKDIFFYIIFLFSLYSLLILKFSPIHTIILFSILGLSIKAVQKRRINK